MRVYDTFNFFGGLIEAIPNRVKFVFCLLAMILTAWAGGEQYLTMSEVVCAMLAFGFAAVYFTICAQQDAQNKTKD